MRLHEFILANTGRIVAEWEKFARTRLPAAETMSKLALRDHAETILKAVARDIDSPQSATEQAEKSKGESTQEANAIDDAAEMHAARRVGDGFSLAQVASEYRALRASVVRLWGEALPEANRPELADLTRFNESIDQALTESMDQFNEKVGRSRELFLAMVGHDLRNPLHAILISATALSRSENLESSHARAISQIVASAVRMSHLVTDLMDFTLARLGTGIPIAPAPMDMRTVCQQALDEIQAAHPDRPLRLEGSGDLHGEWDSARVGQIFSNLVGNAVQHGADQTPVIVTLRGEADEVILAVHNEGHAIPQGAIQTIFDPLVRATTDEPDQYEKWISVGLGLYIAREIATAHGGTIDVASSELEGTTFTARLPRRPR